MMMVVVRAPHRSPVRTIIQLESLSVPWAALLILHYPMANPTIGAVTWENPETPPGKRAHPPLDPKQFHTNTLHVPLGRGWNPIDRLYHSLSQTYRNLPQTYRKPTAII